MTLPDCDDIDPRLRGPLRPVVFHRANVFYLKELPDTDDLAAHARCNPGTLKVTCALTEKVLWEPKEEVECGCADRAPADGSAYRCPDCDAEWPEEV